MSEGPIVVGIDGSQGSRAALRVAAAEARAHGRPLRAVMVHGYLEQHHPGGSTSFDPKYTEANARAALEEVLSQELGASPGIDVERVLVTDLPARGLIDQSDGAKMIVVGARGLGGFRGLLLGSVSQQVVYHARCPVLVVPHEESGARA
jgi:nucleotide-binding universal stress UspA family protein